MWQYHDQGSFTQPPNDIYNNSSQIPYLNQIKRKRSWISPSIMDKQPQGAIELDINELVALDIVSLKPEKYVSSQHIPIIWYPHIPLSPKHETPYKSRAQINRNMTNVHITATCKCRGMDHRPQFRPICSVQKCPIMGLQPCEKLGLEFQFTSNDPKDKDQI